jgi:osmotically-inducible protein OsmY
MVRAASDVPQRAKGASAWPSPLRLAATGPSVQHRSVTDGSTASARQGIFSMNAFTTAPRFDLFGHAHRPAAGRGGGDHIAAGDVRGRTDPLARAVHAGLPANNRNHPMKTDSQLQQDVNAELKWEPSVHAARIGVEAKDGVVTLAGQVDSYAEKWSAERAALRVSGVKTMASALQVQLPSLSQRSDADVAAAVENVLEWASALSAGGVKVMVEQGWVTLSGAVDWQFQKQAAGDSVRLLMGVVGVDNQIGIKPSASASVVSSDIAAALQRAAIADARKIHIAIHGSDITLSGTVGDWAERETAVNSAWATPGVSNVVDMMTLAH